ncbi:MAG: hypothetical protein QOK45_1422, partial [Mycobacterium sp.]|nr:hypothetical protein [Mycobacterium sp.]
MGARIAGMSGRISEPWDDLRVDAAYYDELAGRVRALHIAVEDRLPPGHRDLITEFLDHAEYGVA